jgi:hypothetical protein
VTTQVFPVHTTEFPQAPLLLQVCTPFPEHLVVAGAQTPVHPPNTQA